MMPIQKIPFRETHSFTDFFLKYIEQDPALSPFFSRFPSIENFKDQVNEKSSFPESTRNLLVDTLQRQYAKLPHPDPVKTNIQALLSKNAFTVVIDHHGKVARHEHGKRCFKGC